LKTLFLLRHAKSSWKERGLSDFDRPLNSRGERDAPIMGERLKARHVKIDLIMSSPAKRALKTAQIIAGKIAYHIDSIREERMIYGASAKQMMALISTVDDRFDQLLLVGHNPTFTLLAETLCKREFGNLPTCGIVEMSLNYESWAYCSEGLFELKRFDYPKKEEH
jgi:phosphohistidine phosphatase